MDDEPDSIEPLLRDLDLEASPSEGASEGATETPSQDSVKHRLTQLKAAGAITDDEYSLLLDHHSNTTLRDEASPHRADNTAQFGSVLETSSGSRVNFSIYGVFPDIDTTELTKPEWAVPGAFQDVEMPHDQLGGPGRTLTCWQIHNHSNQEIKLRHKYFQHIASDDIAYQDSQNPLEDHHFEPGWRTDKTLRISPSTRIKYVTVVELPTKLASLKISGFNGDDHQLHITEPLRFRQSQLPIKKSL